MMGVTKSKFPARVGALAINQVSHTARVGSAEGDTGTKYFKNGIVSSAAMAAKILGALIFEITT